MADFSKRNNSRGMLLPQAPVCVESINLCGRRLLQVERLKSYLLANGYPVVNHVEEAEYVLVAGCAFNSYTETTSLESLAEYKRRLRPTQSIFVLEGVADMCAERLRHEEFCNADHVIPTTEFSKLDLFFERKYPFDQTPEANIPGQYDGWNPESFGTFSLAPASSSATVFSVQVGIGCLDHCTYCGDKAIVGNLQSRPMDLILAQIDQAVALGYRAIELIGDDIGSYGLDIGTTLPALLTRLSQRKQIERISFLEVNVKYLVIYESFLKKYLPFKTLRKMALAFQSGSDRILGLMSRGYCADDVRRVSRLLTNAGVWKHGHVIVGFPSETSLECEQSCDLLLEGGFESATIFLYQDRPGTVASGILPKVPDAEKRHRLETIRKRLSDEGFAFVAREDKLQVCKQGAPL